MSRQIPYQPMRQAPVASEAEVQAMLSRLKRRAGEKTPDSQASGVAQSPPAKSKLEWEKAQKDSTAIKTKCGRYSCCKVTVDGKLHYELWALVPGGGWFHRIDKGSGLDNFLQAQVMAQQDADK